MGSYVPTTAAQREEMLAAVGVKSLEELYRSVPHQYSPIIYERYCPASGLAKKMAVPTRGIVRRG